MSTATTVLILPGWQNSGPDHWQSRWEALYGDQRVQQHDWMQPLRGDWMMQLEEAVLAAPPGPIVLAAHSLGCLLTAAWASHSRNTHRVVGALLVAPGDAEREEFRAPLKSWSPIVLQRLPFASTLLGSHDDPYCTFARAQHFATAWGSTLVDYGHKGHINAESGLGDWPEGRALLNQLIDDSLDTPKIAAAKALHAKSIAPKLGQPIGVSEGEIAKLESRLGFRLPTAYREYLGWMGRDLDGIFRGSNWFLSNLDSNKEVLKGLLEEVGSGYEVTSSHLVFFTHQGHMAAWFDVAKEEANPECWYINDGMREPAISGKFTEVLLADLQGLSSCL